MARLRTKRPLPESESELDDQQILDSQLGGEDSEDEVLEHDDPNAERESGDDGKETGAGASFLNQVASQKATEQSRGPRRSKRTLSVPTSQASPSRKQRARRRAEDNYDLPDESPQKKRRGPKSRKRQKRSNVSSSEAVRESTPPNPEPRRSKRGAKGKPQQEPEHDHDKSFAFKRPAAKTRGPASSQTAVRNGRSASGRRRQLGPSKDGAVETLPGIAQSLEAAAAGADEDEADDESGEEAADEGAEETDEDAGGKERQVLEEKFEELMNDLEQFLIIQQPDPNGDKAQEPPRPIVRSLEPDFLNRVPAYLEGAWKAVLKSAYQIQETATASHKDEVTIFLKYVHGLRDSYWDLKRLQGNQTAEDPEHENQILELERDISDGVKRIQEYNDGPLKKLVLKLAPAHDRRRRAAVDERKDYYDSMFPPLIVLLAELQFMYPADDFGLMVEDSNSMSDLILAQMRVLLRTLELIAGLYQDQKVSIAAICKVYTDEARYRQRLRQQDCDYQDSKLEEEARLAKLTRGVLRRSIEYRPATGQQGRGNERNIPIELSDPEEDVDDPESEPEPAQASPDWPDEAKKALLDGLQKYTGNSETSRKIIKTVSNNRLAGINPYVDISDDPQFKALENYDFAELENMAFELRDRLADVIEAQPEIFDWFIDRERLARPPVGESA